MLLAHLMMGTVAVSVKPQNSFLACPLGGDRRGVKRGRCMVLAHDWVTRCVTEFEPPTATTTEITERRGCHGNDY